MFFDLIDTINHSLTTSEHVLAKSKAVRALFKHGDKSVIADIHAFQRQRYLAGGSTVRLHCYNYPIQA